MPGTATSKLIWIRLVLSESLPEDRGANLRRRKLTESTGRPELYTYVRLKSSGRIPSRFNRFSINAFNPTPALETNTQVGIPGINIPGDKSRAVWPALVLAAQSGILGWAPGGAAIPRFEGSTTYEIVNNWTKISGGHQVLFGGDVLKQDFNFLSPNASTRGGFNFNPSVTARPYCGRFGFGHGFFLSGSSLGLSLGLVAQFPGELRQEPVFMCKISGVPLRSLLLILAYGGTTWNP